MATSIAPILDLYSKFLIAFIGIVTPALAIFLNNYLIDRTRFLDMISNHESFTQKMVNEQFEAAKGEKDTNGSDFLARYSALVKVRKDKVAAWKIVVERLNPKTFFRNNLLLLIGSMFFLFVWLFIRTQKMFPDTSPYFFRCQLVACALSIGFCAWHIYNLIVLGFYLIDARKDVDEINENIKRTKEKKASQPNEIDDSQVMPAQGPSSAAQSLN